MVFFLPSDLLRATGGHLDFLLQITLTSAQALCVLAESPFNPFNPPLCTVMYNKLCDFKCPVSGFYVKNSSFIL